MKAVRLHGPRTFRIDDVPEPSPGPGEVKIAVRSVGVCASDVHYFLHGRIGSAEAVGPFILGHEFSGVVEQVGDGVSHLQPGQPVTAEPVRPCGACPSCQRGEYNVCPSLLFFGTPPQNGCLCEHVVCLASFTFPLPQGTSLDEGAMTEPLAVGVEAAAVAGPVGGASCLVIGAGAIGLSALQALRADGARCVAVLEPIPERRAAALQLGALNAAAPEDAQAAARLLGPDGPDLVVEAAGEPDTPQLAVDLVRPGGTVVLTGIPEQDVVTMRASTPRRKGLTIKFVRRYRHRFATALGLLAAGRANVASYVTHVYGPEQTAEAFELTAARANGLIRAVIRF